MQPLRLLLVEDAEDDALLLVLALENSGYAVTWERIETAAAMQVALAQPWDVIIADYNLPRFSGLAALAMVQQRRLDIPFLVVSGTIGEDMAVAAMKAGAHDYIMKSHLAR